jgi:hypothetical protein
MTMRLANRIIGGLPGVIARKGVASSRRAKMVSCPNFDPENFGKVLAIKGDRTSSDFIASMRSRR